jgi:hypothetical protein
MRVSFPRETHNVFRLCDVNCWDWPTHLSIFYFAKVELQAAYHKNGMVLMF